MEMEDVVLRRIAVQLGRDGDLSDASKWRIRQLARAGLLDRQAVKDIRSYTGIQSDMLDVIIETAALHEIDHLDYAIRAADAAALSGAAVPPAEDTAMNAMRSFRRQAQKDINAVNTVMRYKTKQAYVTAVNTAFFNAQQSQRVYNALGMGTAEVVVGAEPLQTAIRDTISKLSEKGIPAFVDRAGREWTPEAYVRMDIRTTVANTARQANFDRCGSFGINLIEVDAHAGARPLCAPYQGRIYSLDGSSGTVKDGSGNEYSYEPLTSTSYGQAAGLFGINCGHHNYPFKPGVNFKRYFPLETEEAVEENAKTYAKFQKQRALERNIRAAKRDCMMCDAAGDKEGFAKASEKLARRKEAYSDYCKSAGLHQRKDRTQVYGFDKSVSGKVTWANRKAKITADKGLTSGSASGKIKSEQVSKVSTGGIRNEKPLSQDQIQACTDYAKELGFAGDISYSDYSHTAFVCSTEGERYCRLVIGTDAYPSDHGNTVNGKLSYRAAIAHEVVGHYEAWNGDFSLEGDLDEAQASIRAGRFAAGLTDSDRTMLYRDGLTRLKHSKIKLKDARKQMRIDRR